MPTVNDLDQLGQRVAACTSKILKLFPQAARNEDWLTATMAFQRPRPHLLSVYLAASALSVGGVLMSRGQLLSRDGGL